MKQQPMNKAAKMDDPKQVAAFRKAARELGCETDEKRFQEALRKVAKHKPKGEKEAPKSR